MHSTSSSPETIIADRLAWQSHTTCDKIDRRLPSKNLAGTVLDPSVLFYLCPIAP